jgi:hypothetical protein
MCDRILPASIKQPGYAVERLLLLVPSMRKTLVIETGFSPSVAADKIADLTGSGPNRFCRFAAGTPGAPGYFGRVDADEFSLRPNLRYRDGGYRLWITGECSRVKPDLVS